MEGDETKSAKSEEKPKKGGEKDPTSPTREKEEETQQIGETSKLVAYLLWFFLGWAGIHHFYLRRYRQGVLWLTSFGGLFGIGKAANNNPHFLATVKDVSIAHNFSAWATPD